MGIGLGIVLLVAGLILVMSVVNVNVGFIDETGLGWILLVAGVLAIILSLVINAQRRHRVEERRYDGPPPRY